MLLLQVSPQSLELSYKGLGQSLYVFDVYGPYGGQHDLWDRFIDLRVMSEESLIIGGDLNFTINNDEIWGDFSQVDKMGEFFVQKLEPLNLIDAEPTILNPTRRNNKKGGDIVSKCLDQFLVGSQFFQSMDRNHT